MNPTLSAQDDGDSLFWSAVGLSVMALSLPAFLALIVLISVLVHPNMWVYTLIPLAVTAPAGLIAAVVMLFVKREGISRVLYRRAWAVVVLGVLAGVSTVILIYRSWCQTATARIDLERTDR